MTCSFVAYIDESGDEGFKFLADRKGSSRWFVLSAAIFRRENSLAPVEALKRVRLLLNKPINTPLHFRDMRHEHRVAYVSELAKESMLTVSVHVHKPSIREPERYQHGRFLLYKYTTRLLLERVSWLCAERRSAGGDATVELVFSDRAAMSYEDLKSYLRLLQKQAEHSDRVRIDWSAINPENVRAVNHQKLAGLQVADAVASSHFFALNENLYGNTEPRYVQTLRRHVYKCRGKKMGYGLKFWPEFSTLKEQMPHSLAAFEDW